MTGNQSPKKRERRTTRAPRSPEEQENRLIALATDLAESQLRAGTASTAVITHYLKLGTAREQLELERLRQENELTRAKAKALEAADRREALYEEAIRAMNVYSGSRSYDD